ncbi:MAG: hypothetical protein EPO29_07965 [Betaproteobacteria bacterium]|nr:MAG: hypothetical protein EPO29_07965 [Betaproteobacteria bacterium]
MRGIFKKRADEADAKVKGLPASFSAEKAAVEKNLADLRAANAEAGKLKLAEDALKSFPASPEATKKRWEADKAAAAARTGPPRPHATPYPGATEKARKGTIAENTWWDINPISAGIFGVPLGFIVIIVVSLLTKALEKEVQELVDHVRYPVLEGDLDTRGT